MLAQQAGCPICGEYTPYTKVTEMSSPESDSRLVYEVPEAGALLGLSRNASYEAAKRGDFPTIKLGKLIKVPKAAFHRLLNVPIKTGE
jgi:excisionase family DNA binding protein